jgi:hypothetical protein
LRGLASTLERTARALRVREDWTRIARLGRRALSSDRVVLPHGPPGPGSPELARILLRPERDLDVALGATLLAGEDDPTVDVAAVLDEVDRLAWGLRLHLRRCGEDPASRLDAFNRYFFDELGFRASQHRTRDDEERLAGLLIHHVLRRRRGHCVGLSSVYLALGLRVGLPVFGVSAPNHVFVRWDGEGLRRNVELTSRGLSLSDDDYVQRFRIGDDQVDRGVHLQSLRRPAPTWAAASSPFNAPTWRRPRPTWSAP